MECFNRLWMWKTQVAESAIHRILGRIPAPTHLSLKPKSRGGRRRLPRGLFNGVGQLESWLFGTATEGDIEAINHKLAVMGEGQLSEHRVLVAQEGILHDH